MLSLRFTVTALASGLVPLLMGGVVGACSSSSSGAHNAPGTPDAGASSSASIAHFSLSASPPNFMDVPFPSDVYLSGGTIMDPIPGYEAVFKQNSQYITHELGKMDGFSRTTLAMFYIDPPASPAADGGKVKAKAFSPLDPTSLPTTEAACLADTSSVFILDLTSKSPAAARVACRATYHDDSAPPASSTTRPVLAIGPARGVMLAEATQYAVVVTSRVKDTGGNALAASSDFSALAAGTSTSPNAMLYSTALATANADLQSALAADGAQIVAIAPYTTNAMTKQLFQLRESLDSEPAPTLAWDAKSLAPMGAVKFAQPVSGTLPMGFTASLDAWLGVYPAKDVTNGVEDPDSLLPVRAHDKIAAIGTAVFQANNYLTYQSSGYSALDDATFSYDASGHIQPSPAKPKVPIWVSFAVPTAPMPAAGYPLVIVQHGLGESRADEFTILSNTFCSQGWMVAAIDSVTFGARAPESYYQVDTTTNWVGGPGVTYDGPDGLADLVDSTTKKPSPMGTTNGSNDLFGGLLALGAFRDQVRQAEIDTTQLVKVLMSSPNLAPLQTGATAPKIDATKLAYFGLSLGSLEGEVAAALEPNVKTWVFDVGGGGLITELASHGPIVGSLLGLAGAVNFGFVGDQFDESDPMMAAIQMVADPADALNFAPYLITSPGTINGKPIAPRNVMQISVVYDAWVPNEANEAFARAAGYGLASPNVGSNAGVNTMALVRDPTMNLLPVPLPDVMPDANGLIHDTPTKGITAVLVQTSPAGHGDDSESSTSAHEYAIPYGQFNSGTPYPMVTKPFTVKTSYRQIQATMTRFFSDAFAGKVPNVTGFKPPIRDYDDDGYPDATDADPNDPLVH